MSTVAHKLPEETRTRIDVRASVFMDAVLKAALEEYPNTRFNVNGYASLLIQSRQLAIQEEILAALLKEDA